MKRAFQMTQLTVVCADVSGLLFDLSIHGIGLHHVYQKEELSVSFCIRQQHQQLANKIIEHIGGKVVDCIPASVNVQLKGMLQRPVLIFGGMLLLFLTFLMPTRILFVTVSGNESIPPRRILASAADCGIRFGAVRREVRSEKVKNSLLSSLPELKWVGVNTKGCVAQISVRERTASETEIKDPMVSSIIASCEGVIREMTVTKGSPICRVGQAVKKGQLLVSGYSDCGRCIYGTKAQAEIYAQTRRSLRLSMLTDGLKRENEKGTGRKYGLIIGKKRINFYKGSGISDTTCVRMYVECPLTLPGGFELPVALTIQKEADYDFAPKKNEYRVLEVVLNQFARSYLESQMVAGKVGQEDYQITETNGALHLVGQYICDEMIGQTRSEEIVNNYEQTD